MNESKSRCLTWYLVKSEYPYNVGYWLGQVIFFFSVKGYMSEYFWF